MWLAGSVGSLVPVIVIVLAVRARTGTETAWLALPWLLIPPALLMAATVLTRHERPGDGVLYECPACKIPDVPQEFAYAYPAAFRPLDDLALAIPWPLHQSGPRMSVQNIVSPTLA